MEAQPERLLFSPKSAAAALDCSLSQVYALMKTGRLPWVYIGADRKIPAEGIKRIAAEGVSTKAA